MRDLKRTKGTSGTSSVAALWASRDFRLLCTSQILAGLGEWMATMALIALVWERTHSAIVAGLVLGFRLAPAALLGSLLASFAARFDRKRVLVACTAGRALAYGFLPLVTGIAPVLALALVAEVAAIAYMSARDATMPRLVPAEYLPTANAISMGSAYGAMPIGSGLFALFSLFGTGNVPIALATSGGLFAIATLIVGRVNAHACGGAAQRNSSGEHVTLRESLSALKVIFKGDPILRRVLLGGTVAAVVGGVVITLGLAYVRGTLGAGAASYSGLLISFCFGVVGGVIGLQKMRSVLHHLFHAGVGAMGVILVLMAMFPSTAVGFGMGAIFGAAFVVTFLGGITILQERVDESVRGQAFALAHSGLRLAAVATGVLAAWIAHIIGDAPQAYGFLRMDGTQVVFVFAGLVPMVTALAMWLRPQRAVTQP